MYTVRQWLEQLGLPQYAEVFAENDVDLEALRLLAESDLEKLGVSLGHRKKLLKAVSELEGALAPTPTAPPIQASPLAREPEFIRAEGERRQLTVLFCDMVGFTELANRVDPEVLQRIIRSYEDACAVCITRYEGYVFQRLGDGIVAFFGYPLAHEGEAERAIRAGLEIIETMSKLDVPDAGHLAVRIGIATGLVVVSSAEKSAVGETMNLASRLQVIAQPGSIVVSERVHRLAGGGFDYQDLGEQTLKGIAQPTHAYRILGVSEAASRFEAATQEGLTPLVGRELEIGLLLERWQLAQDGEGQVVLLSGESGIGKSRILSALRDRLEGQGAQTLRFQCSPYYVNSAFWPSIDNFERALKFGRDESPESKLDKLEALIVTHYGCPLADVRFIAAILSIPCEDRYGAIAVTPRKHKDETLRSLVDLTEAASRKQPSVMLFEDLHWADPTTLEALDLLIDRVRTIPLLIVLTHRPEFQPKWASHGHVTALNLSKLTRAQGSAMVSKLGGGKALPGDLLEQIIAKTDGVPLFLEELTKSILESGELKDAGDRYEYIGSAHTITIPATLRDSLMARLDRFMPVKEVAQIGATIGREFSYELIGAVAPMPQAQLDDALARLTESGLAFRRGTPPDALYTFKHALVQDAAYDSLLKSRRQELHAKIAHVIEDRFPTIKVAEPELLAHHYTRAGAIEVAIPLWCKAGELALKRMALKETIAHMNQGLELVGKLAPSPERDALELPLRSPLVTAWSELRGWASREVSENANAVVRLAKALGKSEYLPAGFWGGWQNTISEGRVADSLEWAQRLLAEADATGSADLRIVAHAAAVASHFFMGQSAASREHCDRVLALYDERRFQHLIRLIVPEFKTYAGVFASLSTWNLGYPDQSVRILEQTDAHARRLGKPFDLSYVLTMGSYIFSFRREPKRLLERAAEAERLAREHSMVYMLEAFCPASKGLALVCAGQATEAIALLRSALAHKATVGSHVWNPYVKAAVSEALALQGACDRALLTLDEVLEQIYRPRWQERVHLAEVLRLKGWMLMRANVLDEAEVALRASIDVAREQQARSWELRTSTSLARLWQSQGKRKEAYQLLAPIYGWFTEGFDTKDLQEAKALLDELNT